MGCGILMRARLWRFISGVGGETGLLLVGPHICQLACLKHAYILSLLVGSLIAVAPICLLACWECPLSRMGFPIRLKHKKVEIGQEKIILIEVKGKLSARAVVKEKKLGWLS